ncbi:P-loop containing nucleoside triphosphate hydrolase protein [Cadophora sp. DSE1049]|nr:P-loop containing nucleoside triphosphate hydrolase protein [Cadophora sp. DSE1049]
MSALIASAPALAPAPKCACSHTSGESQLTVDHLEQLISKLIDAKLEPPKPSKDAKPGDPQPEIARASKLEFKTVIEVWGKEESKYKTEEAPTPTANTLDEYVFILRTRVEVLKDVYGVSLMEDKPSVERNLLYHFLPSLNHIEVSSLQADNVDAISTKHLSLLIGSIREIDMPTTQRLLPLLEHGEITYDLLPMLFKPNTPVYTTCFGTKKPRCVMYDSAEEKNTRSKNKYLSMDCRLFDFDGKAFGKASIELVIPKFRGTKRINTLPAFPLKYHPDENQVKSDFVKCGRKFVRLIGTHHCHCQGEAFFMEDGDPVRVSVDSRVMVDANFFWKMNPNYTRPRANLAGTRWVSPPRSGQVKCDDIELFELKEDELLICCATVPGFSLDEKLWVEFAVADIEDIKWSPSPYACLSISDEQRDVIMALVEARLDPSVAGPPGVGKTLTVEAVSESLKRPIYSISVGELPLEAAKLEYQLSRIFKTANHWNAILLLDEADVFLERRSPENLARNGLVSVFLRKLEYYEGIMFLTTNRVANFDEAILSRTHLMLRYDDLTREARKQVWGNFLSRAIASSGKAHVTDKELDQLASNKFNGRQNIMSSAHAFATREGSKIRLPHVEKAVKVNEKFFREFYGKDYVNSTYY